jgi:putative membrane protein
MTIDAVLAIVHHLAAFSLVALLVAEFVLVRGALDADTIGRFGRIDGLYGLAAVTVIVAGIARVVFGAAPVEFYLGNVFFWLKMGSIGVIAIISVLPTARAMAWRKAAAANASFVVPVGDLRLVRRAIHVELAILPLIPVCAALMARGVGAL